MDVTTSTFSITPVTGAAVNDTWTVAVNFKDTGTYVSFASAETAQYANSSVIAYSNITPSTATSTMASNIIKINAVDAAGYTVDSSAKIDNIKLKISVPSIYKNGYGKLWMMYYDEKPASPTFHMWVIADTNPIRTTEYIQASFNHLTDFALFYVDPADTFAQNLANYRGVIIYPNPYVPNDGNDATGKPFTGSTTDGSGIIIYLDNLVNARITMYTIAGQKVFSTNAGNNKIAVWDSRNEDGKLVASGVYLVVIESDNGGKIVKKIAIVR